MAAAIAVLALALAPAGASAASPVLEFASPTAAFPISFTAEGGVVTAALTGFDTEVECTGSNGNGQITGPRSTVSSYSFTGCETQGGSAGGHECKSAGANAKEIKSETVAADLVFIDQAKREVGMVLNPFGGTYMEFECGGESVKAIGSFLSPVGPINQEASAFSATLSRMGALQIPNLYENWNGETVAAVPTGERNGVPAANTGVELSFAIHPSAPLQIKAVTAKEVEAKQREEAAAAAAAKKRQDDEAAAAAAAKKRQEDEAAAIAAKQRQEDEQRAKLLRQRRAKALTQCRQADSKTKRVRCETRVKKKYAAQKAKQSAR